MNTFISIQIVLTGMFLSFILGRYGILPSFSAAYYELKKTSTEYLFTVFSWGIGIPMFFITAINPHPFNWLFFLSGIGMGFVGAAGSFTERMTKQVHYIAAFVAIASALIGIALVYSNWYPTGIVLFGWIGLGLQRMKNKIYWGELLAFFAIIIGLMIE